MSLPRLYGAICWLFIASICQATEPLSSEQIEFFESRIRPVLAESCYECHNSIDRADGELKLDFRDGLLRGGTNGSLVVPGQPGKSRLLAILRHEVPDLKMPEGGAKLDQQVIADFERWIAMGAPDPRDQPPTPEELSQATSWDAIVARRKTWWSLQPIRDIPPAPLEGQPWSDHPIDHYIQAQLRGVSSQLDGQTLQPGPHADAHTLIRRAWFTVIGLPPTTEDVKHWTARLDQSGGYEDMVDHLLARPQFGERWARHWMDWIRYCDSHGSEGDPAIENGWLYRDYLIRALNADIPYQQLVREHIAGDLLPQPRYNTKLGINESLIATAHWRMVFHGFAPTDALDEKVRFIDDEINTVTKAFLGLTVSCARCHDHKFDAISQKDYYALFGILNATRPGRAAIDTPEKLATNREELVALKPLIRQSLAQIWLENIPFVQANLLADDGSWQQAENPRQLLNSWKQLRSDLAKGEEFTTAWNKRVAAWNNEKNDRHAQAQSQVRQRWLLGHQTSASSWRRTGFGLQDSSPASAGEFSIAPEGDSLLLGIYPTGIYSHALSNKHPARLTSADLPLDGEYSVWIRTIGSNATSRYVIHDYPRNGTVYPVVDLKPEWNWVPLDLSYWEGDVAHLELATSQDAPLMAKNSPRSWFGVREVVITRKSGPAPHEPIEFLDPWFEQAAITPPTSVDEAADQFVQALSIAIQAWQAGPLNDSQALLLDASLKQGLLPNQFAPSEPRFASPNGQQLLKLVADYRRLEAAIPVPTRVPSLEEATERTQPLYTRGDHKQPAELVPRGFLSVLNPQPYPTKQSGRLQLAEDLVRSDNPLTRRVIVNRLWHHLFGRGLVATPDNFGRLGQRPTHPELLDHLAVKFEQQGGSLKHMIRYLLTSQTWQLTSSPSDAAKQFDPDNQWLSHAFVRRLEAEAIRDSLLVLSGQLNPDLYGPPVDGSSNRRSLYLRVQRNNLDPFLRSFDFPEPFATVGRRDVTNVPAQALMLMNDKRVATLANAWASRVVSNTTISDEERIQTLFLSAFARPVRPDEVQHFQSYLQETARHHQALAKQAALWQQQITDLQSRIRQIEDPVRQRLMGDATPLPQNTNISLPTPVSRWDFRKGPEDLANGVAVEQRSGAKIDREGLFLNGQGYALTPLIAQSLSAKTLEVWVQTATLQQQGGGVMTIQTPDGTHFDSIVFAEQSPQQWLAGSEFFARTQSFHGTPETAPPDQPVHLAISWSADGTIACYRNGELYGQPYKSQGPHEFKAGQAIVSFGVRHLPASGNRLFSGRILRANLYDRGLTAEEVAASAASEGPIITQVQILASLTETERRELASARQAISEREQQLKALGSLSSLSDPQAIWSDAARALITVKEFIYLR